MTDFRERLEAALGDQYTFERELGGGGMSRTFVALEPALSRRVVVKVLAPELLEGLSVERFNREVLVAAGLQHPHVVPVLAAGDAGGVPWFSMPFVEGESLRQRLDRGPLHINESVRVLRDVARALAYAHGRGIVHRDIKPDNVLLSDGSASVTDFGIAKAISSARTTAPDGGLTQAGMAIGTPAYMAPEQAAGDPHLDHRADLYAFGAMAYELLAGQPVFAGQTPARVLAAHMRDEPVDLRTHRPDVPDGLAELVMRCLAKDPDHRPDSATDVADALEVAAREVRPATAPAGTAGTSGRAALGIWAAMAVGTAVVLWIVALTLGLPDWAIVGAAAALLAGLPAIGLTWWSKRVEARTGTYATPTTAGRASAPHGTMDTFALKAGRHLSWRRTWQLGATVVGAFGLLLGGFFVSRASGIGPAASLMGGGTFDEREMLVVADFAQPGGDTLLGMTLGEALRTDLAQSENLTVLSRASGQEVLQRMQRSGKIAQVFPVAREIATREGAKAVVDGAVARLGSGYVLSARLVSALDGSELATFRETADGDDELIRAVGQLSRTIRERVGESLVSIRATNSLERVTTSSLAALRKYMEGVQVDAEGGDPERAMALYEDAVALDSGFAMAWRKMSMLASNAGLGRDRTVSAMSSAWRFRDRLSDDERDILEGSYYRNGPIEVRDRERSLAAYNRLLARDPDNRTALNNAALIYSGMREYEKAAEMRRVLMQGPDVSDVIFNNHVNTLADAGAPSAALDSVVRQMRQAVPNSLRLAGAEAMAKWIAGDDDGLLRMGDSLVRAGGPTARNGQGIRAIVLALRGRRDEAFAERVAARGTQGAAGSAEARSMVMTTDSALAAALFDGDEAAARTLLARAVSDELVNATSAASRPWRAVLDAAMLARDSVVARRALEGFEQDRLPALGWSAFYQPRYRAIAALAAGQWDSSIQLLRRAIAERALPSIEESFLLGMAHDRAGRADSAMVWYERSVSRRSTNVEFIAFYTPTVHLRLGELREAAGDLEAAITHYEWLTEQWKDADAKRQVTVRMVASRIAALRTRLDPG